MSRSVPPAGESPQPMNPLNGAGQLQPSHSPSLVTAEAINNSLPEKVGSTLNDAPQMILDLKSKIEQFLNKDVIDRFELQKRAAIGLTIGVALLPLTLTAWLASEIVGMEINEVKSVISGEEETSAVENVIKWAKIFSFLPEISMSIGMDAYLKLAEMDKNKETL